MVHAPQLLLLLHPIVFNTSDTSLLLIQRDMPEEAGEVGLNSDEVMVYTAEESELVSHPFVCIRNLLFVVKEV